MNTDAELYDVRTASTADEIPPPRERVVRTDLQLLREALTLIVATVTEVGAERRRAFARARREAR